jgi:hypothetical protein
MIASQTNYPNVWLTISLSANEESRVDLKCHLGIKVKIKAGG